MFCSAIITLAIIVVVYAQILQALNQAELFYKIDADILEDARLDVCSLVKKYKYPCEIHTVTTEDGYILDMHRIPYGRDNPAAIPGRVAFLQHGLLSSSAEWVLMRPGRGLAYVLAEAGYDVWMGNARGNTYGRSHESLKPSSTAFWMFTWHEIGYYDVPAMIDYVLYETKVPKVHYIAFSQGTTAFWVMTSSKPEYNDKIVAMQAMAPVGYFANAKSPLIKAIAPFTNSIDTITKMIGANEMMPSGIINKLAGQKLCIDEAITQVLCTNLLFLVCGFDADQLNTTMLPIILGHTPAGASTRQFIHFGQLYNSGKFVQFDHGMIRNKLRYGTYKPPAYNLTAITTPIFLHYGENDWLSTPKDVKRLAMDIPSAVGIYRVPLAKFNHLDFVFGTNATELIYNRLINIMTQFN